MGEQAPRNEPRFVNLFELPWEISRSPRLAAGLEQRLVSGGPEGGATLMLRIPPGWSVVHEGDEATVELFVLEGDVAFEGEQMGVGGYAFLPRSFGAGEFSSERGAQAFVFWSPSLDLPSDAQPRLTSFWREQWQEGVLSGLPYGRKFKTLRRPDVAEGPIQGGSAGFLRVNQWLPGYLAPNEHRHSVWEELIFLHGEWLTLERGLVAAGSYLGNPAGYWHGPLASRFGALAIVHSDRPLDLVLRDSDSGAELTSAYLEGASLLEPPLHTGAEILGRFGVSAHSEAATFAASS